MGPNRITWCYSFTICHRQTCISLLILLPVIIQGEIRQILQPQIDKRDRDCLNWVPLSRDSFKNRIVLFITLRQRCLFIIRTIATTLSGLNNGPAGSALVSGLSWIAPYRTGGRARAVPRRRVSVTRDATCRAFFDITSVMAFIFAALLVDLSTNQFAISNKFSYRSLSRIAWNPWANHSLLPRIPSERTVSTESGRHSGWFPE